VLQKVENGVVWITRFKIQSIKLFALQFSKLTESKHMLSAMATSEILDKSIGLQYNAV